MFEVPHMQSVDDDVRERSEVFAKPCKGVVG